MGNFLQTHIDFQDMPTEMWLHLLAACSSECQWSDLVNINCALANINSCFNILWLAPDKQVILLNVRKFSLVFLLLRASWKKRSPGKTWEWADPCRQKLNWGSTKKRNDRGFCTEFLCCTSEHVKEQTKTVKRNPKQTEATWSEKS